MLSRFSYAANGLRDALRADRSVQLHVIIAVLVVCAATVTCRTATQWALLIFAIALVVSAELLNSAIETLANHLHPDEHPFIRRCKDIAAAGVFVAALAALCVGILVFVPDIVAGNIGPCLRF